MRDSFSSLPFFLKRDKKKLLEDVINILGTDIRKIERRINHRFDDVCNRIQANRDDFIRMICALEERTKELEETHKELEEMKAIYG